MKYVESQETLLDEKVTETKNNHIQTNKLYQDSEDELSNIDFSKNHNSG